jgi:hypothetical protein
MHSPPSMPATNAIEEKSTDVVKHLLLLGSSAVGSQLGIALTYAQSNDPSGRFYRVGVKVEF